MKTGRPRGYVMPYEVKLKISQGNKGKKRTIQHLINISEGTKRAMKNPIVLKKIMGSNNSQWMGDAVGYDALHDWVSSRKPKPELCSGCHERKAFDLANISQKYKRDLDDWEWLCRLCHMKKDGRLERLSRYNKLKSITYHHLTTR